MSRRLRIAALVSVLVHLLILAASLEWSRRSAPPPEPDKQATVELLMVEQKGSGQTTPPAPAPPPEPPARPPSPEPPPAPPTPDAKAAPAPAEAEPPAAKPAQSPATPTAPPSGPASPAPAAPPPTEAAPTLPAPTLPPPATPPPAPPAPAQATAAAEPAPASPPAAPAPMEFNLGGTDSASNAVVSGDRVVPASIDNKARNRPPIYPEDAVRRGQRGAVVLLIHVSAQGLTAGVDVLESSGVASLDRSAYDAVMSWRFLPAVKDGQPVPFDMPMRFVFEFN